jgi:prevent-host-death family protein
MPKATLNAGHRATVTASNFKQRCLALVDEVQRTGHEFVVTRHGRPVARLVPVEGHLPTALGWMAGTVTAHGDLEAPEPAWDLDAPLFPR